jgi:hypothetical protein
MDKQFHASIRKIIEARNQNKLVIFIGAGVSMNSDIPSWNSLIDTMRNDLNIDGENDFIKIAELYHRQRGHNEYITKVRDVLKYKRAKYTDLHKLIFELKPLHVITTNYDDLLEQYVQKNSLPYQVIKQDADLPYANGNNYILKMHGDLELGNIVLKENDYLNYSENFPLIESYIKSLFASKLILFIGFSYSDWNLKFIMQKVLNRLGDNIQPSYLIDLKKVNNASSVQADYLKSYGITVLNPDKDINEVKNNLVGENGKMLYNFLNYIINYNSFEVETRGLDLLQKLDKGFLEYSEFNVFIPNKITSILKSVGITSSIDIRNSHCLVIKNKGLKEFLSAHNKEWNDAKNTDEKLKLLERYIGKDFTKREKEIIMYIWEKTLLSGIYYLTYETVVRETLFLNLFDPQLFKDEELDLFYKCDFIEVDKKINNYKDSNNLNELIIAGFLSYKTNNYLDAYNFLNRASSIAWQNGKYLKYYLCKYNIEKLRFHFRYATNPSLKDVYKTINDDIVKIDLNEIYYTLPLKDRKIVNFLIEDFINSDFKSIDFNITKRKDGDRFSFDNHNSLTNRVFQTWNFINYNYLFGEHFEEYKYFYKKSFNEFLKTPNVQLRRVDLLIAIHYLTANEIVEIITNNKIVSLNVSKYVIAELKRDFNNIIESCSNLVHKDYFEKNSGYSSLFGKLLNNYLQIFSFIKLEDDIIDEIIENLFSKLFYRTTHLKGVYNVNPSIYEISEVVSLFINNQKLFGANFKEITLNKVLDFSIDIVHFQEMELLGFLASFLPLQFPGYKVPQEHFEKRVVDNISIEQIDVFIKLQAILNKDYSSLIKKIVKDGLDKNFRLYVFQAAFENGYISFNDYKNKLYKNIGDYIETNNFPFDSRREVCYFAKAIIEQKINFNKDIELQNLISKSDFLKFWLDLDNFDFSKFEIDWVLYYNDTLYNNHKKSPNINLTAGRIKEKILATVESNEFAKIYFTYFEKH